MNDDVKFLGDPNQNFFYCLATTYGEMPEDAVYDRGRRQYKDPNHQELATKNRTVWNRWWWQWINKDGQTILNAKELADARGAFKAEDKADPSQADTQAISARLASQGVADAQKFDSIDFQNLNFETDLAFNGFIFVIGVSFKNCLIKQYAGFTSATFSGIAWFNSATFSGDAWFTSATFSGDARFTSATFSGDAWFNSATFRDNAGFFSATFSSDAVFNSATFSGDAWFNSATFSGDAWFNSATFSSDAVFNSATFSRNAWWLKGTKTEQPLNVSNANLQETGLDQDFFNAANGNEDTILPAGIERPAHWRAPPVTPFTPVVEFRTEQSNSLVHIPEDAAPRRPSPTKLNKNLKTEFLKTLRQLLEGFIKSYKRYPEKEDTFTSNRVELAEQLIEVAKELLDEVSKPEDDILGYFIFEQLEIFASTNLEDIASFVSVDAKRFVSVVRTGRKVCAFFPSIEEATDLGNTSRVPDDFNVSSNDIRDQLEEAVENAGEIFSGKTLALIKNAYFEDYPRSDQIEKKRLIELAGMANEMLIEMMKWESWARKRSEIMHTWLQTLETLRTIIDSLGPILIG